MTFSPLWHLHDLMSKVLSPYELNPANVNPLRDLLLKRSISIGCAHCPAPRNFLSVPRMC